MDFVATRDLRNYLFLTLLFTEKQTVTQNLNNLWFIQPIRSQIKIQIQSIVLPTIFCCWGKDLKCQKQYSECPLIEEESFANAMEIRTICDCFPTLNCFVKQGSTGQNKCIMFFCHTKLYTISASQRSLCYFWNNKT